MLVIVRVPEGRAIVRPSIGTKLNRNDADEVVIFGFPKIGGVTKNEVTAGYGYGFISDAKMSRVAFGLDSKPVCG